MKKNYFKVAIRNFIRYKWNSIFNVFGLSIGIACSIYIFTLINYELGYDRFHKDIDLVYRICQKGESRGTTSTFGCVAQKYSDYILENYEGIDFMARYAPNRPEQVVYKDKVYMEARHKYVEPDIFNIIKTKFIYGNRATCLTRPNTVVITNSKAQKYFGNADPTGEVIQIDTAFFEVTGVIEDMPGNSRFKDDFYESWITYINSPGPEGWNRTGRFLTTYIKFNPEANIEAFEEWIKDIPEILFKETDEIHRGETDLFIQPLKDLHLSKNSNFIWDWEDSANPVYVYILIGTVLLILVMSALNYINLNIASYSVRAREVGIRKTIGATRKQLIYQFLGESLLVVFVSHIIGLFLVELFMPMLNNMTEMNLKMDYLSGEVWLVILSIIIILGLGAGSYPAFYLSLFNPARVAKKNIFSSTGNFGLKELLIVIQFSLSIILIIGTSLIFRQVNYMKNRSLGVSLSNKFVIELPQGEVNKDNFEQIKNEFVNTGLFSGASVSSSVPGRSTYTWNQWPEGEEKTNAHPINCMEVDYDYFDLYGLELAGGVKFDTNLSRASNSGYLLNEEAVKIFGWESVDVALEKMLQGRSKIRGVIKNYHYKGLQKSIEPIGLFIGDADDARYLTLQWDSQNLTGDRIHLIKDKFEQLFPEKIFSYFFMEDDFNTQYKSEDKVVKLFIVFTVIAILIACIGLFGMTAFFCLQKEKSMGIRKVFGADSSIILLSLIKRFTFWVILSFMIAVPISVTGIKMWLNNFAYRTNISVALIIAAGLISILVTIVTVLYHSIKLSRKNPVDILKYE